MAKCATREAYGKALAQLIQENERVIVLDADLAGSTKTSEAKKVCPQRHFDVGIAEGNMMGIAAGLAASKYIVFASSFAMFAAGRAFEQIRNCIGYPHLNVGEDGASHQCNEDLALMRVIPGMTVIQPCDEEETKQAIRAVANIDGPCYVRLGRGKVESVYDASYTFEIGKGNVLRKGKKVALVASGMMVQEALKTAAMLEEAPTVVNISTIKPLDTALIKELAKTHDTIITCEEHSVIGGLGSAVSDVVASSADACVVKHIGVQDTFGESGDVQALFEKYGINAKAIVKAVQDR